MTDGNRKTSADVVEAREFRLVDEQGEARAVLGLDHEGRTDLSLLGPASDDGRRGLAWLTASADGSSMSLEDGSHRQLLMSMEGGVPSVMMWDADTESEVLLSMDPGGSSDLLFADRQAVRVRLSLQADGRSCLSLYGADGQERVKLELPSDGPPSLELHEPGGR